MRNSNLKGTEMEYGVLFNDQWSFLKTELGTELSDLEGRDNAFCPMDLPHDWLIYNTRDLYENSTGWYRKHISVVFMEKAGCPGTIHVAPGQRVFLRFDGVYMLSLIHI